MASVADRILEDERRRSEEHIEVGGIGFQRWLELMLDHGDGIDKLNFLTLVFLTVTGFLVYAPLGLGMGTLALLALWTRYKRDLRNPPWWLKEALNVER